MQAEGSAPGPLSGVRIIDMTAVLLGPVATQIFGDLGADVIKVESPSGDTTRSVGAFRESGMSSLFLHINRNKRSIVLDLKQPEGRAALHRLIADADVLFHNMRPRALAAIGADYETVSKIKPDIIHCGAFGYGQGGRYADQPAYDDLIQSAVAIPSLFKETTGKPSYIPTALIDRMVAQSAACCVNAALYHREKTGEGQCIQVPMFETMAQMVLGEHMGGETFDPPQGPMGYSRLLSPFRRPYQTADGYVSTMAYTDRHWQRFFVFVGRPELASDSRFKTLEARTQNIDVLYEIADQEYARRTTDEWIAALTELDIPVFRVHTLDSLMEDPHLHDVDFFQWTEHPSQGRIRTMAPGTEWSKTPLRYRSPAPLHGEHSAEILKEVGYSEQQIEMLHTAGTTKVRQPQGDKHGND